MRPRPAVNYSPALRDARLATAIAPAGLLFLILAGLPARTAPAADADDPLTVSLLTIGPGSAIYERFGHNAIVIDDRRRGISVAYNFGIFSFEDRNFILRFIQGRMRYRLEAWDAARTVQMYIEEDRSIWLQQLNLSSAQKLQLLQRLEDNARPENAAYLYDYYADNCSTRVRDALDAVLGGLLRNSLEPLPANATYRDHTRRSLAGNPLIYAALALVLGQGVDRPLSAWEESFMPLRLRDHLRRVSVTDADGASRPLVALEQPIYASRRFFDRPAPPHWLAWFLAVGALAGAALAALSVPAVARRTARLALAAVSAFWCLLAGGGGLFILIVWLFTSHVAAYRNENLLHFSPLALPLAIIMPAAALGRPLAQRLALPLAALVLFSSLLGVTLKLTPLFTQFNAEIIALALPAHAGMCFAAWRLRRVSSASAIPPAGLRPVRTAGGNAV